jgi:hypothetical protein
MALAFGKEPEIMMGRYHLNSMLKNSLFRNIFSWIFRIDATKGMKKFILNKNVATHADKPEE